MLIYKRVQLKKRELIKLQQDCEDYIWAAVDPSNYTISLGDDYLANMRDCLLVKRSLPENIYGVGLDLTTGRIDYVAQINRRNPTVNGRGELSSEDKANIEKVLHYFFEKLPVYRSDNNKDDEALEDLSDTTIAFC